VAFPLVDPVSQLADRLVERRDAIGGHLTLGFVSTTRPPLSSSRGISVDPRNIPSESPSTSHDPWPCFGAALGIRPPDLAPRAEIWRLVTSSTTVGSLGLGHRWGRCLAAEPVRQFGRLLGPERRRRRADQRVHGEPLDGPRGHGARQSTAPTATWARCATGLRCWSTGSSSTPLFWGTDSGWCRGAESALFPTPFRAPRRPTA